ncbi:MAG: hypothetical protein R3B96_21200 [Pirellulaceae bacterium]
MRLKGSRPCRPVDQSIIGGYQGNVLQGRFFINSHARRPEDGGLSDAAEERSRVLPSC